ncbi:MAG: DUF4189 domain-containing protein [Chakrabartia sp.]
MNEYARQQQEQQRQDQQDRQQDFQGPPPPRQNWVTSYMSVTYHPDASDIWAVWDRRVSQEEADQSALGLCMQMMGNGCKVAAGGHGGTIAIARDNGGWLWWEWGDQLGDATRAVTNSCSKNGGICEVVKTVTANHWLEFENGRREDRAQSYSPNNTASLLNSYAMVAWPTAEGAKSMDATLRGKAWLVSGSKGYENTKKIVLDQCKEATHVACEIGRQVSNGYLVLFQTKIGETIWGNGLSQSDVDLQIEKYCRTEMKTDCTILARYDAATRRSITIDDHRPKKTYLAVAQTSKRAPNWDNLAVVTGFPTLAAAKAKAIEHCTKESGGACSLFDNADDEIKYGLLSLFIDQNGEVYNHRGWTNNDLEQREKSYCDTNKLTCRVLKVFELNKLSVSTLARGK